MHAAGPIEMTDGPRAGSGPVGDGRELVSICICTYQRPRELGDLLDSLLALRIPADVDLEIVVVDNDPRRSAEATIEARRTRPGGDRIASVHEPRRGISHARNRCLDEARGSILGFIDDDECCIDDRWLETMLAGLRSSNAIAVFGPAMPRFAEEPPHWVREGRYFERPRFTSGERIAPVYARTSNVLMFVAPVTAAKLRFEPEFAFSGGEDTVFFHFLSSAGAFVWIDDAMLVESIPPSRANASYLIRRTRSRGASWVRFRVRLFGRREFLYWGLRGLVGMVAFAAAALITAPVDRAWSMRLAVRAAGDLGKIGAAFTGRAGEYGA